MEGNAYVGGLVGYDYSGTVETSYATGDVTGNGNYVGGLVGWNVSGTISTSYAIADVTGGGYFVGGLVGNNVGGKVSTSYATGDVRGSSQYVGGLAGQNQGGTISTSYATGAVTGSSNVGGLVGYNGGGSQILISYAAGKVAGGGATGGLIGLNSGFVQASYWDKDSTPIGIGYGDTRGAIGRTTAEMQDINAFAANYEGWNFVSVWVPPNQAGQGGDKTAYYPELYALSRVVAVQADDAQITYGESRPVLGGIYHFGGFDAPTGMTLYELASESIDPNAIADGITIADPGVGKSTSGFDKAGISALNANAVTDPSVGSTGQPYRVVVVPGTYTVTQRALTVTANAQDKVYDGTVGATVTLSDDRIAGDQLTLDYASAVFADKNAGTGKQVTVSGITLGGADAGNYTFNTTALTTAEIRQRALVVTANDAAKVYDGVAFTGGNGVSYDGFVNGEGASVLGGTLLYGGNSQGAVNAGTYQITVSGLTSNNYAISYAPGTLTVDPRPVTVTANAQTKVYGNTLTFTGTEFAAVGLVNGDEITTVTLTSAGAGATASVGGYAIVASDAVGNGLTNYTITYVDGTLTVVQLSDISASQLVPSILMPNSSFEIGGLELPSLELSFDLSQPGQSDADSGDDGTDADEDG